MTTRSFVVPSLNVATIEIERPIRCMWGMTSNAWTSSGTAQIAVVLWWWGWGGVLGGGLVGVGGWSCWLGGSFVKWAGSWARWWAWARCVLWWWVWWRG